MDLGPSDFVATANGAVNTPLSIVIVDLVDELLEDLLELDVIVELVTDEEEDRLEDVEIVVVVNTFVPKRVEKPVVVTEEYADVALNAVFDVGDVPFVTSS